MYTTDDRTHTSMHPSTNETININFRQILYDGAATIELNIRRADETIYNTTYTA